MVSDKRLGIFCLRVFYQRSDSRPSCKHVASSYVDIWGQVMSNLGENPVDFILVGYRILGDLRRCISCTSNGVPLPWQEEDHSAVWGFRIDKSHLLRAIVAWKNHMNAGTGRNDLFDVLFIHLSDGVYERTCSVDDTFRFDLELLRRSAILFLDKIFDSCTT